MTVTWDTVSVCMFLRILATTAFLSSCVAGCFSTGHSTKAALTVPKTVREPANIPPEVVPYYRNYVLALEAKGFAVGPTDNSRALSLWLAFNSNPYNMNLSVSLLYEGKPVLTGSATNLGLLTVAARAPTMDYLADKSLAKFRAELEGFVTHVQIVSDAP